MDNPTTSTSNTLPSYLASLSPHTWYDYTSTPALALDLTLSSPPSKPHKPKPPMNLLPSDILTLATLLPSTRPLLLSPKFLKALDITPEETVSLTKALKEQQPSSDKLGGGGGGGAIGKSKSKLELLREQELQLAKEEAKEEAKAEKKKEAKRRREIDHALGLVGNGKGAGKGKGKTYGKIPKAATTTTTTATTTAATATDSDQGQQLQGEKEEGEDGAEQEGAEQRKKRKIKELDRQLGLFPTGDDLPDEEALGRAKNMPELVDIKRTQSAHIDTGDAAAVRRAGIDALLGLVENNATPGDEHESQSEKESDLMNRAEVTRRRINADMDLLNSARMAQMDAILGFLSPRKAGATRG